MIELKWFKGIYLVLKIILNDLSKKNIVYGYELFFYKLYFKW